MSLIPRRSMLAGFAATALSGFARNAQGQPAPQEAPTSPLADRLAAYAERLSDRDIDSAAVEAVKVLVVDSFGCAIASLDEKPVRICRELAAAAGGASTIIGTGRRTTPDL